ncbi:MAG TPA: secretin N-terminal domain-containing protein [Paucimonas sp.]|nr:secretin N-terminal domain-containing protein [Paucimonas sp.]
MRNRSPFMRLSAGVRTVVLSLFAAGMLAGCAAQMAYWDGKTLVGQGKIEDGLARLHEAAGQDPRNVEYRKTYLQTRDHALAGFLEQADRFLAAGKSAEAKKLYQRALVVDPNNDRARAGVETVDAEPRHAKLLSEAQAALDKKDADLAQLKLRAILAENPRHAAALALKRAIAERTAAAPQESALSAAYRKPITIEFKDVALKQVFEVIARTSGLNFLFDKDVKTDQKTSIFLRNSTVASAVHFVLLTNQLEQQVLDGNTILIYPNTAAKLKDYQEMVVKTFFLSNAEAKTVAATLKTIVKSRDVVVDEKLNMLIVRDSPEAIRLAEKLVALHDVAEPEVMLEVEILEVKRTRLLDLGIRWPENVTLTPLASDSKVGLTLRDLNAGFGSRNVGVGVSPLVVNAKKQDTDANILANPRIRARNHEKAKILIGERVPNITTTSTSTGFVSESVNYVDVGLKLDVEPTIYADGEVAIKVALEVSNIVSRLETKSGSVAYQIGTRNASTVLRLKDGENQVLAGLINDEDRSTANKVPGFGEIPIVGRLFGSTNDDSQKTEIVLSITPRLIRNIQRPDAALSEFRAGTDSSFRLRPDAVAGPLPVAAANAATVASAERGAAPSPNSAPPSPTAPPGTGGANNVVQASDVTASQNRPAVGLGWQWQGPAQVKSGETFTVQLALKPEQPISNLPVTIGFDNKLLQIIGIAEGDFLKQGGAQTRFNSRVEPHGQVVMTGVRSGAEATAAPGTFATLTFRALAAADAARIQVVSIAPGGAGGKPLTAAVPSPHIVRIQQ